jgi:HSP20 family protein
MSVEKYISLALPRWDPYTMLRQLRPDIDQMFDEPLWPAFQAPGLAAAAPEPMAWSPTIEVLEKDNRLITKVDLPGVKKEDVKVEVTDGQLTISGERKREGEEETENVYRCEREYGRFYRSVVLPERVKLEDVKATFADGVLEVSVPMPVAQEAAVRQVDIQEPGKPVKSAA